MTRQTYRDAFLKAQSDFEQAQARRVELIAEIADIDKQLVQLRRGVIALGALAGESVDEMNLGLTESIRTLMSQTTKLLTTKQVVEGIADLGFDLSTQTNPAASVQAVLTRLAESKEITRTLRMEATAGGARKHVVYWLGPNTKAGPTVRENET